MQNGLFRMLQGGQQPLQRRVVGSPAAMQFSRAPDLMGVQQWNQQIPMSEWWKRKQAEQQHGATPATDSAMPAEHEGPPATAPAEYYNNEGPPATYGPATAPAEYYNNEGPPATYGPGEGPAPQLGLSQRAASLGNAANALPSQPMNAEDARQDAAGIFGA